MGNETFYWDGLKGVVGVKRQRKVATFSFSLSCDDIITYKQHSDPTQNGTMICID